MRITDIYFFGKLLLTPSYFYRYMCLNSMKIYQFCKSITYVYFALLTILITKYRISINVRRFNVKKRCG